MGGVTPHLQDLLRTVAAQDGDQVFYMHSGSATHALEQIKALTEFVNYARSLGIQFVNPGQIWGNRNLISDPYFNATSQWGISSKFSWDDTVKYHGTRSVKFTPGDTGNHSGTLVTQNRFFPTMAVPSGMFGIYRMSARIKTAGATVAAVGNGIRFNGSSIYKRMNGETPAQGVGGGTTPWLSPESSNAIPAMEWKRGQAYTYIGPATNTFQLSVYIQNIVGGSNPIWIDEIKMELVGLTPEVTVRGALTGNINSTSTVTHIHDAGRHNYVFRPDTPPKGVLSATVSDGQLLRVSSSDPSDTTSYTVTITPGGKYHDMTLTSEGA